MNTQLWQRRGYCTVLACFLGLCLLAHSVLADSSTGIGPAPAPI